MPRTVKRLVEEVGVGVFDAVIVGDWKAVGVRVVDGRGGLHDGGRVAVGSGGNDGDELAEEVAFGAQVGGPLGGMVTIINSYLSIFNKVK